MNERMLNVSYEGQDKIAMDYMREVMNTSSIYPGLSHGSVYSLISSTARSFAETHDWNSLAKLEFPPALTQDLHINAVRFTFTFNLRNPDPVPLGLTCWRLGAHIQTVPEVDRLILSIHPNRAP